MSGRLVRSAWALFIAVPLELRRAGLPTDEHWHVYLPVMAGSFILMLPAIMGSGHPSRLKSIFIATIALLLIVQLSMPWGVRGVWPIALFLLAFFTAFNVLEALLPTLVSATAAPGTRGTAIGVFTSLQFFGTFVGAAAGGYRAAARDLARVMRNAMSGMLFQVEPSDPVTMGAVAAAIACGAGGHNRASEFESASSRWAGTRDSIDEPPALADDQPTTSRGGLPATVYLPPRFEPGGRPAGWSCPRILLVQDPAHTCSPQVTEEAY